MASQIVFVPAIGIAILILALVVFVVWRRTGSSPREIQKKSAKWFLAVGVLYMAIAIVVTALVHGTESVINDLMNLDLTLFNLGLLFFVIGAAAMIIAKFKARSQ
ncbi:MAG TPA: hypothetical protein VMW40_06345 [Candidatus Bathyarchaeia archaeon]|nr:hypothetical protein [Candidatus Bathyarchaeia archaeon]